LGAEKGRIAQAAGILVVAFVGSRALGLVREMVISRRFGTSWQLDAYLAAFRAPDFVFQLVAGGALASALIPTFSSYLARGEEGEVWRLASGVFNIVGILLTLCAGAAALFARPLLSWVIAPGFDSNAQELSARLMRLMFLSSIIFGWSAIAMAMLNSYQHFLLPALAPIAYNLSIIAGALFLAPAMGIYSLAVGVVVGAALHLAIQMPGLVRKGLKFIPSLELAHPGVREVGRLMLPRAFGIAVTQLNFLVNTILASSLAEGSLAALNYAWMLMMLPQGLFAMTMATAAFPTLAELAARGEQAALRSTFSTTLRVVLYLTLPAGVGLFILRKPLIRSLLERGEFSSASTEATAWALQFYALGLVAYAVVEIAARAFYALHDTKTPVLIGAAAMGVNVALSLAFIGSLAHGGLALANVLATCLEAGTMLFALSRRLAGIEAGKLARSLVQMLLAAALMGVAISAFLRASGGGLLATGGAVGLGASIYLLASLALGSEESRSVGRLVRGWRGSA